MVPNPRLAIALSAALLSPSAGAGHAALQPGEPPAPHRSERAYRAWLRNLQGELDRGVDAIVAAARAGDWVRFDGLVAAGFDMVDEREPQPGGLSRDSLAEFARACRRSHLQDEVVPTSPYSHEVRYECGDEAGYLLSARWDEPGLKIDWLGLRGPRTVRPQEEIELEEVERAARCAIEALERGRRAPARDC